MATERMSVNRRGRKKQEGVGLMCCRGESRREYGVVLRGRIEGIESMMW